MQVTWKEIKEDSIINVCQLMNCWEPHKKQYSGLKQSQRDIGRHFFWANTIGNFQNVEYRNKWVAIGGIKYCTPTCAHLSRFMYKVKKH